MVHLRHHDYLTVLKGRVSVGLLDLRSQSLTYRCAALIELSDRELAAITLPNGVLHGVYSRETTLLVYGLDCYYDPGEEPGLPVGRSGAAHPLAMRGSDSQRTRPQYRFAR